MSGILNRLFSALSRARRDDVNVNADGEERQTSSAVERELETSDQIAAGETTIAPEANPTSKPAEEQPLQEPADAPDLDELEAYDYELPERLVAQSPLPRRESARMMVVDRATGKIEHRHCYDIVDYLRPEDALVLNDTKVLPARLIGSRALTGGRWEGLFLQYDSRGFWEIMSKTRGYLRPGEKIELLNSSGRGETRYLEVVAHTEAKTLVVRPLLKEGEDSFAFLDKVGWVPIPPYIRSGRMKPSDREDYQTVYAKEPGSVAAPTAGLHFTKELLEQIKDLGVAVCPVTLHVGAGTFKPITVTKLSEHYMHSEYATIPEEVVRTLEERKARGGRVVAIGTTSVRTSLRTERSTPRETTTTSSRRFRARPIFSSVLRTDSRRSTRCSRTFICRSRLLSFSCEPLEATS